MELVKRLTELIPFLEPYPPWVKIIVGAWTLLTTGLLLVLLFTRPKDQRAEPLRLSGRIVTTTRAPVSVAAVELVMSDVRKETVSDSEGDFRIEISTATPARSARVRVAASGYKPYERIVEIAPDKRDLGTFTLQPDGPAIAASPQFTPEQLAAVADAASESLSWGADEPPTPDAVYNYLDSIAAEAAKLAQVWREVARDLNDRRTLDGPRIAAIRQKYDVVPRPNEPYFHELNAFLRYLPEATGGHLDASWNLKVTDELTEVLASREVSIEKLERYLRSVSATDGSQADVNADLRALNKAVHDLQVSASNLHALAKAIRAADSAKGRRRK